MGAGKKENLIGKRYGMLTVVREAQPYRSPCGKTQRRWECRCDCGKTVLATTGNLNRWHHTSCGCVRKKYGQVAKKLCTTHGGASGGKVERLYKVWANMKSRCYNKNSARYKDWGGRGITVCDEWKNDYAAFRGWAIENGYDETARRGECTIDRINNDLGYYPQNCRFVSAKVQAGNRRDSKSIREG